jgi:hypothetical protein
MEVFNQQTLVKDKPYFSGYTRVAMAICCGVILILMSTSIGLWHLLFMKRFYFALCFNFLLALLVIELIHWVNVILDRYCSWQSYPNLRMFYQFFIGIVGVLYIDYWLVRGVYHLLDMDFSTGGFLSGVFPTIAFFVFFLHGLFYVRRYDPIIFNPKQWYSHFRGAKGKQVLPAINNTLNPYWQSIAGYIQSTKYIFNIEEVVCIATGAIYGDIFLKNGRCCNMHYKGAQLREQLDPEEWVEIRSGKFFALSSMAGISLDSKQKKIILKEAYQSLSCDVNISRRYYSALLQKFKSYQAKHQ